MSELFQFHCGNRARRDAVFRAKTINGIDFLEVASVDQKTLRLTFVLPLPGQTNGVPAAPALTKANIAIEGGVRVKRIEVQSVSSAGKVLTVSVKERGDFSNYTLRLVANAGTTEAPAGLDPALSAIAFSFKVNCPSDFDCRTESDCPPAALTEPELNYLAKDYASFRRLMLDRLSVLMPGWRERSPADLQVTLTELLAATADHLSYYQDAVATESYLGTARKRISARRHARLLDYAMHDGCNARAWVHLRIQLGSAADGATLPKGTAALTRGSAGRVELDADALAQALRETPIVFETMHAQALSAAHNELEFHTWSDTECCLPRGATRATLRDDPPTSLAVGDALLFEEIVDPVNGIAADADPRHRQIVRLQRVRRRVDPLDGQRVLEIEWHADDALQFPLCLSAMTTNASGQPALKTVSVARGNIVLADHGLTYAAEELDPPEVPVDGHYRPKLARTGIAFAEFYDHAAAIALPAVNATERSVADALPAVRVFDEDEEWTPQRDLLASGRFNADVVVELETNGEAMLRFGDGTHGKKPESGSAFTASCRVGNGLAGNIGADALCRIANAPAGILAIRNPLPAEGGMEAETIEEVRQFAPEVFRRQERAVTAEDYAAKAEEHPDVQKAAARFRWTGSWYTVFVGIDRKAGRPVEEDPAFEASMRAHLDRYRMAGHDVEIHGPLFVPLEIVIRVCVKPGYFRSDVQAELIRAMGRDEFFHPDRFTFGQPVYLSQIYATVMAVDGVASAEVTTFQRWGKAANGELDAAVLTVADLEIARCDSDPNFPENGAVVFEMNGGL